MSDSNNKSVLSGKRNKLIIAISAASLVIIVALVAIIVNLLDKPPVQKIDITSDGRGTLVTEDNAKELAEQGEEPVADGYYTTSMNVDWYFDNGKAESKNAYVENDVTNTRTVYFDLLLADSGEMIYSSPYIPVGAKLENFALSEDLSAGDYDAVVKYHLVDDDHNEISTVSVAVTVHVLK